MHTATIDTGTFAYRFGSTPGSSALRVPRRALALVVTMALMAVGAVVTDGMFSSDPGPRLQSAWEAAAVVGVGPAAAAGLDGAGTVVAVLDTGVAPVPGLVGRLDGPGGLGASADPAGHGTHLAGIAAGDGGGVTGAAPGARVADLPVAGDDGLPDAARLTSALRELSLRAAAGEPVVALVAADVAMTSGLARAVTAADDAGVLVVAAVGNQGEDAALGGVADHPAVLSVGAVEADAGSWAVASFSSRTGPDVVAPGRSIVSFRAPGSDADQHAVEGHVGATLLRGTGTSQAAAVVAGAAAVLRQAVPGAPPAVLRSLLVAGAHPLAGASVEAQGAGVLDLAASLHLARASDAPRSSPGAPSWTGNSWTGNSWTGNSWTGNSWTGNSWTGNSWTGNSWTGNSWTGNSWTGNSWTGNSWTGNSWTGNSWTGNSWTGNSWTGNSWTGNSWTGNSWTGNSWTGNSWTGNSWTGNSWTGNSWTGNSWTGNSWTGNSWTGNSWTGNSWTGNSWTGNSWTGNSWT